MSKNVKVVMNPPPWVPPSAVNSGTMVSALEEAANGAMNEFLQLTSWGHHYTWRTTSSAGGWPSEATVMIAISGLNVYGDEFGDPDVAPTHRISRALGI